MAEKFFRNLSERHNRVKDAVHSFRLPLSLPGRIFMSMVYFSIPVVGGLYYIDWAQKKAEENMKSYGAIDSQGRRDEFVDPKIEKRNRIVQKRLQKELERVKRELAEEEGQTPADR